MKLVLFASAWALGGVERCRARAGNGVYDGIEAPVPETAAECRAYRTWDVPYLAEVCTGGSYAPASSVTLETHLSQFVTQVERAAEAGAVLANCLAGSDSWPLTMAVDFYESAMSAGTRAGVELSFETHRSRPMFHPWSTRELLRAVPSLQVTCDFSHWCVVCERMIDDESALALATDRARHVHARVGYAQGPQVPDPRAPEFHAELARHEAWWDRIWDSAEARGFSSFPMTPEFGPDGYLHHAPFTNEPVSDLLTVNDWMAERQQKRFVSRRFVKS